MEMEEEKDERKEKRKKILKKESCLIEVVLFLQYYLF